MSENAIKRLTSVDGTRYVEILERDDGLFRFVETSKRTEDGDTFWTPTHWSGVYGDAARAENDARAMLPWLQD